MAPLNRRKFLQSTGLAASALFTGSVSASAKPNRQQKGASGKARNIILVVSDGMSNGTLTLADQYIRWRDKVPSAWIGLYEQNRTKRALMDTASLNSIVTDSAAAASSWGSGYRVNNGSLNIGPDGEEYTTIMQRAKASGKSVGLLTTATVTHATPAGLSANVSHRRHEAQIAEQYLERGYDLLIGGGAPFFDPEKREDAIDLKAKYRSKGYEIFHNHKEMKSISKGRNKVLGLLADSHLPYEVDRLNNDELRAKVPSLSELTEFSLQQLSQNPEGFVILIEGARVDHGAHNNDLAATLFDQIALDDAIRKAVDFADQNPDTLVIMCSDHGNANPGLSSGANGGDKFFQALSQFKGSHGNILDRINAESSKEQIQAAIHDVTGLEISTEHAELLQGRFLETYRAAYRRMNGHHAILGQIIADHTEIGWVSNTHTSDHVELCAFGPGSEQIKNFHLNTDLFHIMAKAAGLKA